AALAARFYRGSILHGDYLTTKTVQKGTAEQPPEGGNRLTLPYRRLQLLPNCLSYRVDVARAIDLAQDAALTVVVDHRHRIVNVDLDAFRNHIEAVIFALVQFATVEVAYTR